jgi:hypothetical protein
MEKHEAEELLKAAEADPTHPFWSKPPDQRRPVYVVAYGTAPLDPDSFTVEGQG